MGRRYRRSDSGEIKRMLMAMWCRIRMGHDSWSDGWVESLSYGVLIAIVMLLFGWLTGNVARGDLIIEVIDMTPWGNERRVYAGHDVTVELPHHIGYIGFNQFETHEGVPGSGLAMMGVGPAWFGGFGANQLPMGAISIQVLNQMVGDVPRVIWDNMHREIGWSEQAAVDGVLWGGGGPLPDWIAGDGDPDMDEPPVWIPFQWELFDDENTRGNGWVGISQIAQMQPVIGENGVEWITGSGFNIDMVVLAQLDVGLRSGQIPDGWAGGGGGGGNGGSGTAVPEPSIWMGILVIVIAWGCWRLLHR